MKVLLLPFAQAHRNRNLGEAGGFIFSEENSLDFKQSVQGSFRFALYSCISGNHHSFLPSTSRSD